MRAELSFFPLKVLAGSCFGPAPAATWPWALEFLQLLHCFVTLGTVSVFVYFVSHCTQLAKVVLCARPSTVPDSHT